MTRLLRILLVVFVVVLGGCGSDIAAIPTPPKVSVLPTTTTLADFSDVSLPKVGGTTTTAAPLFRGGQASISGKVTLGGAPIGGATVRVERYDQAAIAGTADVTSNADGTYSFNELQGGRYRLRAFRPPDAAMANAQVFFLGATEKKGTDLGMNSYSGGGTIINAFVSPDPPILGVPATLTVSATTRGVDASGVARSVPQVGVAVQVASAGGRSIVSANPTVTGPNGRATFTFTCNALDRQGLTVTVPGGVPTNISVSACQLPPTTTTTTVDPAAPTTIAGTPTTRAPSTTTTARR